MVKIVAHLDGLRTGAATGTRQLAYITVQMLMHISTVWFVITGSNYAHSTTTFFYKDDNLWNQK